MSIRARMDALTHRIPDGEKVIACAEKTNVGPERRTALDTAARVSRASEQDLEAGNRMFESDGRAVLQAFERDASSEQQQSRSLHLAAEGFERSQVDTLGLMEAMRPFIVMVCEGIAKALVKVIATQGLRNTLLTASSQSRSRVVSIREEALRYPMVEEAQSDPSPDKTNHEHRLVNKADVTGVETDFALQKEDEGDVLDVQPLFDPKLPPYADSDFKPKIGLVSTSGSDFKGLRQRYPQLHLTIVQADLLPDVRRFGHCQRIIALRDEISAGTDDLLSRLLRHRYIRLHCGMNGVIAQLEAWLASPGSIAAGYRPASLLAAWKGILVPEGSAKIGIRRV